MNVKGGSWLRRFGWQLIFLILPVVKDLAEKCDALETQSKDLAEKCDALETQSKDLAEKCDALETQKDALLKEFPIRGNVELMVRHHTPNDEEQAVIDSFTKLYYGYGEADRFTYLCTWLGYTTLKCPLDLWIYQELICAHRPDFIIETGTAFGGASLYLANICSLVGHGKVITIDITRHEPNPRPLHSRITYLTGSSVDKNILASIKKLIGDKKNILVILDSDHTKEHVLNELRIYCQFIPVGGYLIVEDTNINGHPVSEGFGPGPMEALQEFMSETDCFEIDSTKERFLLTMNPRGYLRRVR